MKSLIKLLSISLFIAAPVLCMAADRKQTQAELDARQFKKEQETKKKKAYEKEKRQLVSEAFSNVQIGNKEITDQDMIRMPEDIQNLIVEFSQSYKPYFTKLPIYYPKEFIPAFITWHNESIETRDIHENRVGSRRFENIFNVVKSLEKELSDFHAQQKILKEKDQNPYIIGQKCLTITHASPFGKFICDYNFISIPDRARSRICTLVEREKTIGSESTNKGFIVHLYSDGIILYRMNHPDERKDLARLNQDQKSYIARLYALREKTLAQDGQSIQLSDQQMRIHFSLHQDMQENLEKNYNIPQIATIRKKSKKCSIKIALASLTGAAAIATAWFLNQ